MIDARRRILLKGSLAAGAVAVAVGAGLLAPRLVLADWNRTAFEARELSAALAGLDLGDPAANDQAIVITAPDPAENGAAVRVSVATELPGVRSIAILAAGNANPLIAYFELGAAALPFVETQIKMAKSAELIAVVKTADQVYRNSRQIKVTVGGCGG